MNNIISDNSIAIQMLKNVSDILNAIEFEDTNYIQIKLSELKDSIATFEEIFYKNKTDGIYNK